ncbi:MAG: site-specific integrase [Pseudobdellovibrio sp.]
MSIREKLINGVKEFEVSLGLRSKIRPQIRVQKLRRGIKTLREAQQVEKVMIRECSAELAHLEGAGITWDELLSRFEMAHRKGNATLKPIQLDYLYETLSTLRKFTASWLKRNCQEVNAGDVRRVFQEMEAQDYSRSRLRAVKSGINSIYRWGIENNEIIGIVNSPAQMVQLNKAKDEKPPQVLSLVEIHRLIEMAKQCDHKWYPVWFTALNTGMRSGELYALEWTDVDFENRLITVSKSYNNRLDIVKSTKAGYWRKVPINEDLEKLFLELKANSLNQGEDAKHVLPRLSRWANGEAAKFLREFCEQIGITSVNFHALRACFATHLLNAGVPSPIVKKICGWTEEKVMTRYIRLAGIDVAGATQNLGFSIKHNEASQNLVNLRNVRFSKFS